MGSEEAYVPKWKYFAAMAFLKNYVSVTNRNTVTNLAIDVEVCIYISCYKLQVYILCNTLLCYYDVQTHSWKNTHTHTCIEFEQQAAC